MVREPVASATGYFFLFTALTEYVVSRARNKIVGDVCESRRELDELSIQTSGAKLWTKRVPRGKPAHLKYSLETHSVPRSVRVVRSLTSGKHSQVVRAC